MIKRFCFLAVLTGFAAYAVPVTAQPVAPAGQVSPVPATASTISGVVRDVTGGVIRGAEVLALPVTGAEARVLTGDDGRFTVTPEGTGAVVVLVHATGFAEGRQTIEVGANRTSLEFVLVTAAFQDTTGVTAAMPKPPPPPPPPPPRPKAPKLPPQPLQPVVNRWYAALTTTVAAGNHGGAIGGEAGIRVRESLDLFVDGGWFNDVATQQQQDLAAPLLSYLNTTTGKVAAASVKRPAISATVGARKVFEGVRLPASLRPYASLGVGFAQVKRKPTLTLGGTDVTSTLQSYGVVLGEDMAGTEHRVAASAGFGVLRPIGKMYIDIAYRLTYIPTSGSSTKVNGVRIGVGARF